jgi:hypothetical protein
VHQSTTLSIQRTGKLPEDTETSFGGKALKRESGKGCKILTMGVSPFLKIIPEGVYPVPP